MSNYPVKTQNFNKQDNKSEEDTPHEEQNANKQDPQEISNLQTHTVLDFLSFSASVVPIVSETGKTMTVTINHCLFATKIVPS